MKIRMTPQREALLKDLNAGARFMVTKNTDHKDIIEIVGGGLAY